MAAAPFETVAAAPFEAVAAAPFEAVAAAPLEAVAAALFECYGIDVCCRNFVACNTYVYVRSCLSYF